MATEVRVIGLDKILKKLDGKVLTKPQERYVIAESVRYAQQYLSPLIPRRTGRSASSLRAQTGDSEGRLSLPAKPLRFLEFGTQLNTSGGQRSRRRRTAAAWRSGSYRIAPRKFMSKAWSATKRQQLRVIIPAAEARIVRGWEA